MMKFQRTIRILKNHLVVHHLADFDLFSTVDLSDHCRDHLLFYSSVASENSVLTLRKI